MSNTGSAKPRNMLRRNVLLAHFLMYLTLSTAAIGQPLLQMYGDNLTVFTTARFEGAGVLGFMVLVVFVVPTIFIAIETLARLSVPRLGNIFHYSFLYSLLLAFVLVLTRSWSFTRWHIHIMIAAVIAVGLLWTVHRFDAFKTWIRWMSPLALIVAGGFVLAVRDVVWVPEVGAIEVEQSTPQQDASATPAEDVSVVWIVLDEAPLYPLLNKQGEINRERFPGFAELAASSTWYRNVLSPSQRTTDAVPSMLSGIKPKVGADPVLARYPKNVFTLLNTRVGFDVREFTTALCPSDVCGKVYVSELAGSPNTTETDSPESINSQKFNFGQFVKDAVVVLGHKVLPEGLRDNLPRIDEAWGGFGDAGAVDVEELESAITDPADTTETTIQVNESTLDAETQQDKKADYRQNGPASLIPPFEAMVSRAKNSANPTLHFQHIMLPHRPWKLTPDQRTYAGAVNPARVPDESVPDNSTDVHILNHEYQAMLMQYGAVDSMIGHLVSELKQSQAWDRTMIVVVADHGLSMESGTSRRRAVRPDQPGTLEDLYRVPLFIKYPDQAESEINDCDAMSYDILPTVAGVKNLDAGWTYDGVDLRQNCPDRPSREISWDKGKSTMTTKWTNLLDRVALYDTYVPVDGGVETIFGFGPYSSLIGSPITPSVTSSSLASWTLEQRDQFVNVSSERFASVPVQISGTVTVNKNVPANAVGLLTINGVVAGVLDEIQGASPGSPIPYRAMLSTSQLKAGPLSVGLTVVSGSPSKPVFETIVTPS